MGKSRSERRAALGLVVDVFSPNTNLGWKVIRQVPVSYALQQIAQKQWREIWYEHGELAGVQPLKPVASTATKTLHQVLTEALIGVTITRQELERNAGLYGRSHTIGMSEWKRLRRHARFDERKILPPEDATERAIEKVKQWPFPANVMRNAHGVAVHDADGKPVFGDKAVRTYPPAPKKKHARR